MITAVTIIEGSSSSGDANAASIDNINLIPNIECMIAKAKGIIKNINICLNRALFIIFSSQPIFRSIVYLCLLSELSVSCFNAKIAELAIKNTMPK